MKQKTYHRFDIDGKTWKKTASHLTGQRGQHSGIAKDNRKFINAVVQILMTGLLWENLSLDYVKFWTNKFSLLNVDKKDDINTVIDNIVSDQ